MAGGVQGYLEGDRDNVNAPLIQHSRKRRHELPDVHYHLRLLATATWHTPHSNQFVAACSACEGVASALRAAYCSLPSGKLPCSLWHNRVVSSLHRDYDLDAHAQAFYGGSSLARPLLCSNVEQTGVRMRLEPHSRKLLGVCKGYRLYWDELWKSGHLRNE